MRIIFMGTPEFSVPTLAALVADGHEVLAVYSQPPRPAGRGMAETKSPVQIFAEASGIPVLTPRTLKSPEAQAALAAHNADVAVVVAYGLLLPQAALDAPRLGCFNLHASLLPRWRGAAPIQRAIMAGDGQTAATVMRMQAGLDTGPVCLVERVAIGADMTAGALHDALSRDGAGLMVRALAALERGSLIETPQPTEGITYAAKISKAEARIDFARPATDVHNHIRGLTPFPGAWFEVLIDGQRERIRVLRSALIATDTAAESGLEPRAESRLESRLKPGRVLDAQLTIACAIGAIRPLIVQRAGKKAMLAADLLRGVAIAPGSFVGS